MMNGTDEKIISVVDSEIISIIDEVKATFEKKNNQYKTSRDPLANFSKGAVLRYGEDNMGTKYETLKDYMGKHIAHIYNNDITGDKVDESLMDIAVYSIIALAMRRFDCE